MGLLAYGGGFTVRICINVLIIIVAFLCFSSCGTPQIFDETFEKSDPDNLYVKNMSQEIVRCFDEKDAESLKELFSSDIQDEYDLDSQIEYAFSLYNGKSQSYYVTEKRWEGTIIDGTFYDKYFTPRIKNIVTDEGMTYSIYYLTYYIYEGDEGRIGITALGLMSDSQTELAGIGKE